MIVINATVTGHKLVVGEKTVIASGSRGVDHIQLHFDSAWDGFGKEVIFWVESPAQAACRAAVQVSGQCIIPWKILQKRGTFCFSVRGVKDDQVIATAAVSVKVSLGVSDTAIDAPAPPDPSVYDQVLSQLGFLYEQQAEILERLENMGGAGSDTVLTALPRFLQQEVMDTASKIQTAMAASARCMLFGFVTDSHVHPTLNNRPYWDDTAASVHAVNGICPFDLLVHGGDMIQGSLPKAQSAEIVKYQVDGLRETAGDNTLIIAGNHDTNTLYNNMAEPISEAEMITLWRYWDDGFTYPPGKLYGYRDYDENGIRVVKLHSCMNNGLSGISEGSWGFPEEEIEWVKTTALNTQNDVLFFAHMACTPEYQGTAAIGAPRNGEQLRQVIDDFVTAGGSVVGMISGHAHYDYMNKYSGFTEVLTGLAKYTADMSVSDGAPVSDYRTPPEGAVAYGRTAGTATEVLWDAVVVNPDAKQVSLIRCGAGADRTYSYLYEAPDVSGVELDQSTASVNVGSQITLHATVKPDNAGNKSVTWSSSDVDVATVQDGVVTAVYAGTATITVKTVDGGHTAQCVVTVPGTPRTNLLPTAVDTDGSIYGGKGYVEGYRLNSSGTLTQEAGRFTTGFISCQENQTVTFKRFGVVGQEGATHSSVCFIHCYDSGKNFISGTRAYSWASVSENNVVLDGNYVDHMVIAATPSTSDLSDTAYIRVCGDYVGENPAIYVQ